MNAKQSPEAVVREIRWNNHRKFSAEEKIRIILEGLKGETSISELYRREGIGSDLPPPQTHHLIQINLRLLHWITLLPGFRLCVYFNSSIFLVTM